MKRKYFITGFVLLFVLVISSGCNNSSDKKATISVSSDSEYVNTFSKLNLGLVFDFDFKLPNADERWVTLWVERYNDGKKESQPLTQLSYGNSPNKVDEGHLGFGMLNLNSEDTFAFLYGEGVSTGPSIIDERFPSGMSSWEYAIGNEKTELELGETTLLAAYRETKSNSMRTVDLQDEEAVNRMIKQDNLVLLLKLKIEDKEPTHN